MTDEMEKQELPEAEAEEEKKEGEVKAEDAQKVEKAFLEALNKGGQVFDLDEMGITTIKSLPKFPDQCEQISLFGNEIENPNDIAEKLVPLPNLKALWLNGNPVVDTCSNFTMISTTMPSLEILNSTFTGKAGEWALNFYSKLQCDGASLAEAEKLDLSGRGILYMPSADVFSKMVKLRKLDISDHPEFFMNDIQKLQQKREALEGLESKQGVEFLECKISI